MTLNLQNVLVILGAIVVLMIYLVSKWQNRTRHRSRKSWSRKARSKKTADVGGRAFRRDAPALGEFDVPDDWEEMPAPEEASDLREEEDLPVSERRENRNDSSVRDFPDDFPDDDGGSVEDFGVGEAPEDAPLSDSAAAVMPKYTESEAESEAESEVEADDSPAIAPEDDWPEGRDGNSRAPVFREQASGLENRNIEGFERLSQVDYWVKITGERDVGRESVLAIYHDEAIGFTKNHSIHGLKTPENAWCNLENEAEDSRFDDLVLTIQLADSNGAISEGEMTQFCNLVARLSEGTGREFVFMTTVENALAQAAALAEFIDRFNTFFVINIHPRDEQRFEGVNIDRCTPQIGLERDDDQHYSRFKSVGKEKVKLYSLANMSDTGRFYFENMKTFSTAGLVFFTQPARNRSAGAVFAEMADTAKAFAARIEGVASAPEHEDLSQDEVDEIRKSVEQMVAEMEQLGIPAGGEEATRLF